MTTMTGLAMAMAVRMLDEVRNMARQTVNGVVAEGKDVPKAEMPVARTTGTSEGWS